jgi:FKBP-type peptidyl-prolyl cis-trans isomerase FkpA
MTPSAPDRARTFLSIALAALALAGVQLAGAQQSSAPATSAAPAPKAKAKASADKDDRSATSYSLGVMMGTQLRGSGVAPDAVSVERVDAGLRDALSGKVKLGENDQANIKKMLESAHEAAGDANHKAAEKFLAENGKKPGVVTTASGLQYKVLTPGTGATPKPTDVVVVNYRGTLLDGTEFDSSYKRGQPATFPVGGVIPGWTEGLQLMKTGGKTQLWVPPKLAYDLNPPPRAPIPPGAMLVFEVELMSIKPPAPAAGAPNAMPSPTPPPAPPK